MTLNKKQRHVRRVKRVKHDFLTLADAAARAPGKLLGYDIDELLMLSGRIIERVKMILDTDLD